MRAINLGIKNAKSLFKFKEEIFENSSKLDSKISDMIYSIECDIGILRHYNSLIRVNTKTLQQDKFQLWVENDDMNGMSNIPFPLELMDLYNMTKAFNHTLYITKHTRTIESIKLSLFRIELD